MRGPAFLAITLALLLGPGRASAADTGAPDLPAFDLADRVAPQDATPEREIRWADDRVTVTDVLYATIPGFRPLRLDLYRDAGDTTARPVVVFLHGGAWAQSNPRAGAAFRNFPAVLAALARRGYAVASVEFRQSGEAPFPAQLDDVRSAIRFLRADATRLGIDGTRIALWGMSSGAHLAALGAVHCSDGTCVQGFVGWFGPYDLEAHFRQTDEPAALIRLLRCGAGGCSAKALRAASPANFVDAGDPPALLIHGADDTKVAPAQASSFAARLRSAGIPAEALLLPDVGHGFLGKDAAATRAATRRALEATFAFFDRVLQPLPATQP